MRKIWPGSRKRSLSSGWRTQPVPSIAACVFGAASTAKTTLAGALMVVVATNCFSVIPIPTVVAARVHRDHPCARAAPQALGVVSRTRRLSPRRPLGVVGGWLRVRGVSSSLVVLAPAWPACLLPLRRSRRRQCRRAAAVDGGQRRGVTPAARRHQ